MDKIPRHYSHNASAAQKEQKGEGKTYFARSHNTLNITGNGTTGLFDDVIQSGYIDDITQITVSKGAMLTGFPPSIHRLSKIDWMRIETPEFQDWESVYLVESLDELHLTGKAKGALTTGIGSLKKLRLLDVTAKGIDALPQDLASLTTLELVKVHTGLKEQLQELVANMPQLLLKHKEFGFECKPGALKVLENATTKALEVLIDSGLVADTRVITIESKAELSTLPHNLNTLKNLSGVAIKSAAFKDWEGLYHMSSLEELYLEGKATGALPRGISALPKLRSLKVQARTISSLPSDLSELRGLTFFKVHPGLKAQSEELELHSQAHRLEQMLERFESWLAANTPDYLGKLQAGLSNEEIEEVERSLGIELPPSAHALYRWRNGDPSGDGRFEFLRIFMTLQQAAELWKMLAEMNRAGEWAVNGVQPPGVWSDSWFPLFTWDNGFHLCVDLTGTYKGKRGQVVEVWMKDNDRYVVAPDLASWLESFLKDLETKVIKGGPNQDWGWASNASRVAARKRLAGFPKKKTTKVTP